MKKFVRFLAAFLVLVMVLEMVPLLEAKAEDYIISIHTAEEFMAIARNSGGSYRLENSIQLGSIQPLGEFRGSLDGNGHTVSFSQSYSSGTQAYGLFTRLNGAQITNLNVNGNISLNISDSGEYYVGILAGSVSGSGGSLGGGNISGSINIFGEAGSVVAGGVAGKLDGSYYMNNVTISVDATAKTGDSQSCSYYGTMPGGGSPNGCFIYGSADLRGTIYTVTILPGGNDNTVEQNVTVESTNEASVVGIAGGERNKMYGSFRVTAPGGSVVALNGGAGNGFEGDITTTGVKACMADSVRGAEVKGNITALEGSVTGMRRCYNSTMNGNITINKNSGGTVYGMNKCNESIFNGNMTYNAVGLCRIYAAYDSDHVQVNGSMSLNQKRSGDSSYNNGGVYGLIECPNSSFYGSLSAKGYDVHAVGACNAGYDVVDADITVDSQVSSSASGVGDNSSFNGTITNKNGSVSACGNSSIAKGTLTGQSVTTSGSGSYFSGTVTARYNGGENSYAGVTIGYAADAAVTVEGGEHGAHFSMGSYFGGSANVSAEDGYVTAVCHYGKNVSMSHKASGVSADSATVLGDRETHGQVYWHRYAADYGHEKNGCDGYIYFGWHSYLHQCYDTVLGVSYSDAPVTDLSDVDWPNGIDPVNGTFKPDKDPVDYVLKVSVGSMDCYNYRLSIGGNWQYPDESGCIAVTQGPAMISPLVVELKNQDGSYSRVLTYNTYYPVPNMVNTILLEPQLDKIAFSFMDAGYSGREAGERWGGIKAELFGEEVPLVDCPMEIDLSVLDYQITVEEKKLGENRWGYSFSLGKTEDVGGLDADVVKVLKKQAVRFAGAEMSIGGKFYVEAAFDPNVNLWHVVGGNFGVEAEIGKDFTYYIYGPIYVNFGVNGGGTGSGGVIQIAENDSVDSVKYAPDGQVRASTGAELAVGAGLRPIDFYLEGGGEGEAQWLWSLPHREGRDSVTIQINYNGFVSYRYMWGGTKIRFQEGSYQLWPFEAVAPLQLSEETFSVLPRTYLSAGSERNGTAARSVIRGGGYTTLNDGYAYPYSQVQLLGLDDGRYVLLYTDDDPARGDADRSALRVRIGREEDGQIVWGEAVTIEDDGTGDYAFTACASYDQVAVVWQDADMTFGSGQGVDLEAAAAHIDLTQAVLDCGGDVPQVTRTAALGSDSGKPESLPVIFYHADSNGETLRTAWTTSTAASPISADGNTTYTLWVSESFGQKGQKIQEKLSSVTGIALFGDELLWSTQAGSSSDLWFRDGAGNITQLKESGIANLQSVGHRYIFTEEDQLMGGEWNYDSCSLQSVSEHNRNALRLTSTGDIYYAKPGLETSRIYWLDDGTARLAGEYSGYLSNWDAANHQIVTLVRTDLTGSDTAVMRSQPREEIERVVLDVVCKNQEAIPGSYVTMYVEAENRGTWDYGDVFTQVAMDDGTVLYERVHNRTLKAGETISMELLFQIPEGFTSQEVTLTVSSATQRVVLGGTNLGIDAQWSQYNPGGVNVIVENTGNADASGTITVTEATGAVLGSTDVTLAQGEIRQIWMDFGKVYTETAEVTVSLAEAEDALYSGDNRKTVWVSGTVGRDPDDGEQDPGGGDQDPEGPGTPDKPTTPSDPTTPDDPEGWSNPFVDITEDMFCYDAVLWAYNNEITTGKDATHFNPSGNCTRSQVVTFLWRAAGKPNPKSSENPFPDVANGKFYTEAVLWAVENGITAGFKDGTFGPDKTCTRDQIVTFLWRFAGEPEPKSTENTFPDVKTGAFYTDAVLWAVENGITTGYRDGTFGPSKTCKRDQIVTFLYRYMAQ